jgi:hypothetical protein
MKISRASLGSLTLLSEGALSRVYRVNDFTLPGEATPLVYKEFTLNRAEQARSAQANAGFRANLSLVERTELDKHSLWPRALVEDNTNTICGFLMHLISQDFFCRLLDPNSGQMTSKPRAMTWLISSAVQRAAAQIDLAEVDKTERLILLTRLAYTIELLHKRNWVFGDLNFSNIVFTLDPPRLLLLGCDATAALADLSRKQSSTVFWDPPECPIIPPTGRLREQKLQDTVTDVYKLGLAILRCLTPGKGAATSRNVTRLAGELDSEGVDLISRALSADRTSRPTATDLCLYLDRVVSRRIGVPKVVTSLGTPKLVRTSGGHVFISYVSNDAKTVDRLQHDLESAGVLVWRDRSSLGPGDRWKDSIRQAIASGTFFLCCFSEASRRRSRSYMNEELALAIEELRVRDRKQAWFLPVLFPGGEVPNWSVGAGETLRDFNYVLLSPETWFDGVSKLIRTIRRHQPVASENTQKAGFDVFLCHNAVDKPAVRWAAERLRERGILPWLDEAELTPGRPWQEELEHQINTIRAAAVFVGPNGMGPWQNQEIMAFLREFVERQCPVIPVLLPDATTPTLPLFLRGMTWVDLRGHDSAAIDRLIWGITGRKPE